MFSILAQLPDPSSSIFTSWFGTGLLGGVLYWLLFHYLPAKDKQMADLLASEREAGALSRKETRQEFLQALRDQQSAFTAAHDGIVTAIQGVTAQLERMEESSRTSEAEVWKHMDNLGTRVNALAELMPRRRPT